MTKAPCESHGAFVIYDVYELVQMGCNRCCELLLIHIAYRRIGCAVRLDVNHHGDASVI